MKPLFICRSDKTKYIVDICNLFAKGKKIKHGIFFVAYYDEWRKHINDSALVDETIIYGTKDIFSRMDKKSYDLRAIKKIEEKYGETDLWNIIFTEWMIVPHTHSKYVPKQRYDKDKVLLYAQLCFEYVEKIFDEHGIDCVIDFARVGMFRGIIDIVSKKRNIPYLYVYSALLKDLEVGDRFFINERVNETYEKLKPAYKYYTKNVDEINEGWKYLSKFRQTKNSSVYGAWAANPDNLKVNNEQEGPKGTKHISRYIYRKIRGIYKELYIHFYQLRLPEYRYNFHFQKTLFLSKIKKRLSEKIKTYINLNYVKYYKKLPEGKYAFITLHLQPEASTSVMAPYQVNQHSVIENIARSLPLDWKLVVKPNKNMIGIDRLSFLNSINAIPNVILVEYFADTQKLIRNSKCVIAITGTSGLEGALMGKKVVLLGDKTMPWHHLKSVVKISDWHNLHEELSAIETYRSDDNDLGAYLQSVHDNSFRLKKAWAWSSEYNMENVNYRSDLDKIANCMIKTYKEYYSKISY